MKFRSKLFCFFLFSSLTSMLFSTIILYKEASRLIFDEVQSKIFSFSSLAARVINPKILRDYIDKEGKDEGQNFRKLEKELIELISLNRRDDLFIQRVYILYQKGDKSPYYFAIGSGDSSFSFGELFIDRLHIPKFQTIYVTHKLFSDSRGPFITGYAPILDSQGEKIALLGIDFKAKEIDFELKKLFFYGLIAFFSSTCVAILLAYFLSKPVSASLSDLCDTVKMIGKGRLSTRSHLHTQDEFNELAININNMAQGLEERERLKAGLSRYVSHYAMEELLKLDKPITLEGERKKVTILFSDIRHFTTLAENLPPEKVLKLLNEYFKEMIEVIFSYGGTLDKFIGDGLLAEFGAPLDDEFQELHAVLAAIKMHLKLDEISKNWVKEGNPPLSMGIGIHTGLAVMGNIGSEKRMEYTAIGDTVNVASRLERLSKELGKPIIISKAVHDKVKDHFLFEDLKDTKLRGRTENVQTYAIDPKTQKNLSQFKVKHKI